MMKTYIGQRSPSACAVCVVETNNKGECLQNLPLGIKPSQHIRNHSSEYQWGYSGSGPAQLALALLLDATDGNIELSEKNYQDFKAMVVARMPAAAWLLTQSEIKGWLQGTLKTDYFERKWDGANELTTS